VGERDAKERDYQTLQMQCMLIAKSKDRDYCKAAYTKTTCVVRDEDALYFSTILVLDHDCTASVVRAIDLGSKETTKPPTPQSQAPIDA